MTTIRPGGAAGQSSSGGGNAQRIPSPISGYDDVKNLNLGARDPVRDARAPLSSTAMFDFYRGVRGVSQDLPDGRSNTYVVQPFALERGGHIYLPVSRETQHIANEDGTKGPLVQAEELCYRMQVSPSPSPSRSMYNPDSNSFPGNVDICIRPQRRTLFAPLITTSKQNDKPIQTETIPERRRDSYLDPPGLRWTDIPTTGRSHTPQMNDLLRTRPLAVLPPVTSHSAPAVTQAAPAVTQAAPAVTQAASAITRTRSEGPAPPSKRRKQ
jgi:hypothetical protein